MSTLEPQLLVVLVAILQCQRLERTSGQVRPGFELQVQDFVTGGNTFFAQIILEGGHIAGTHPENIQCLQLVQMHAFWPLVWQAPLKRKALTLETHAAPEQLNDLRAFPLSHIEQAHGGDTPAAPAFGELARADQHVEPAVLVVQSAKECAAEIVAFSIEIIDILCEAKKTGIVANIDKAEWLSITHPQGQLTFAALDIDQLQPLLGLRIEHPL